jgi:hypothetical protein
MRWRLLGHESQAELDVVPEFFRLVAVAGGIRDPAFSEAAADRLRFLLFAGSAVHAKRMGVVPAKPLNILQLS